MEYNRELGIKLMEKYLSREDLWEKLRHSRAMGDFAYRIGEKIKHNSPEMGIDSELVAFVAYVHDIGSFVSHRMHELHTLDLLKNEGVPEDIALKTVHGTFPERYENEPEKAKLYLPRGIEGMILSFADMSIRLGEPMSVEERANEIITRMKTLPIEESRRVKIEGEIRKALPRFFRYRDIIYSLAGVKSYKEF
jgi:HD superfamily phosphodiesterase